jgi:hypothetical protein
VGSTGCGKTLFAPEMLVFCNSHGFSRAASAIKPTWALQAAEKLCLPQKCMRFVTGHDF